MTVVSSTLTHLGGLQVESINKRSQHNKLQKQTTLSFVTYLQSVDNILLKVNNPSCK